VRRLASVLVGGGVAWGCLISPKDYPLDRKGSGGHSSATDAGADGAPEGGEEFGSGG
jgi:hypothetical protein